MSFEVANADLFLAVTWCGRLSFHLNQVIDKNTSAFAAYEFGYRFYITNVQDILRAEIDVQFELITLNSIT